MAMKRRVKLTLVLVTSAALLAALGGVLWPRGIAYGEALYARFKVFTAILDIIQRSYVEESDPDALLEGAIKGMLSGLDPHSVYLTPGHFEEWNQNLDGYSGIGIRFEVIGGKVVVTSLIEDGPAYRGGLKPGDRIVEIDNTNTIGMDRDEIRKRLMGPSHSYVAVRVERRGWARPRELLLERQHVTLNSITHALMIRPEIGYIKIERFSSTTGAELRKALSSLRHQGMSKLLLDLRGNGGGYLNAAIQVADAFLPGGKRIVFTRGRVGSASQEYYSTDQEEDVMIPLVVLIDHATASAAEIVAGAIQDWDRGLIVGESSFGKGLVQSQYRFHDGSALLLTTARYYTPCGRLIQRDYTDKSKDDYYGEAYEDRRHGALRSADTTPQFKTAGGRIVSGGGGISPDVWIDSGADTLSAPLRKLFFSDQGLFYSLAEDWVWTHPEVRSAKIGVLDHFEIPDALLEEFKALLRSSAVHYPDQRWESDLGNLRFLLKREIGFVLWGEEGRFRVNVTRDRQLTKALQCFTQASALVPSAWVGNPEEVSKGTDKLLNFGKNP